MEHLLAKNTGDKTGCPFTCPFYTDKGGEIEYSKDMLPQTNSLLDRTINISIGVSDAGLGSGFGINILSDENEIDRKIEQFRNAVEKHL